MDIKEKYATPAIGGYIYQLVFSDRSCGYCLEFGCRGKTEVIHAVVLVNRHCKRYGYLMQDLRTDMESVENGDEFK